jgi:hypothetical protein
LVAYPGNPAQNAQDYLNSKSETRISKQSENSNADKIQTSGVQTDFFRTFRFYVVSDFPAKFLVPASPG